MPIVKIHSEEPHGPKNGQTYRLFIHLEVVYDLTFLIDSQKDDEDLNRLWERILDWAYGVPDGGVEPKCLPPTRISKVSNRDQ